MEKAVEDGVDVLSLSIGGSQSEYYRDTVAIGAFSAEAASCAEAAARSAEVASCAEMQKQQEALQRLLQQQASQRQQQEAVHRQQQEALQRQVQSCSGKAEVLTHPHRPYGSNKASLREIKRIREEGGWISNGRICGDIAVSRAFGDMRFKTKKNEMLKKGVEERRWTEKFASRVQFNGDLVTASPDVFQVTFGTDSEFVLLASDGLWDYINSSDAVTFVRNQLRKHGDVQLACDALAEAALDQRSQDNISIVIADLGRTDWQGLPFQQQNVVYEFGQAFATVGIVSLGIWISTSLLST